MLLRDFDYLFDDVLVYLLNHTAIDQPDDEPCIITIKIKGNKPPLMDLSPHLN